MKNEKNPYQRQLSESAESYGSGGYFEKKNIFIRMESKLKILQG